MKRQFGLLVVIMILFAGLSACDTATDENVNDPQNNDPQNNDPQNNDPELVRLAAVETDLLSKINAERIVNDPVRPALNRDPGMDRIMLWHVTRMAENHFLNHQDANGRESEGRAHHYGDNPNLRCSEIIQWWGGTPSGQVHYQGYFNSPSHHAGYLEEGAFSLGPTTWAGLAAISGTGPAGTEFAGRSGSYTGVMFCETQVTITIDPFSE